MTLEHLVEALADKYSKEQVEGRVKEFGLKEIEEYAQGHLQVKEGVKDKDPYFEILYAEDIEPQSSLVRQFGGAFSQEEAEAISAGFNGDARILLLPIELGLLATSR